MHRAGGDDWTKHPKVVGEFLGRPQRRGIPARSTVASKHGVSGHHRSSLPLRGPQRFCRPQQGVIVEVGDLIIAHFDLVDGIAAYQAAAFTVKRVRIDCLEAERRYLGIEVIDDHRGA